MKKKYKKMLTYLKKHKKIRIVLISIISILMLFLLVNFARYVKDIIDNFITRTQRFYFNSDKLTEDNKEFEINYWSGVDSYPIYINVNSLDNNLRGTDIDIDYEISCEAEEGLLCDLSKENGTITTTTNTDSFIVTAVPTTTFEDGDEASLTITAKANEPFEKTLSATFRFVVGTYGISYKIEDKEGDPYLMAVISNTVDYYKVITAFSSYSVGDQITSSVYETLTDEEKANCASAVVTLSFDPNILRLDLTNYYYQNKISEELETIDGYEYVNKFTFAVKSQTSVAIKFYKLDVTKDYTYPVTNDEAIVSFNAE